MDVLIGNRLSDRETWPGDAGQQHRTAGRPTSEPLRPLKPLRSLGEKTG